MTKLYHSPLLRSVRIYWLLEELGLPYRLETLAFASVKSPEYLKVHPLGKIPAIQDGDLTMSESGAILEYILEKYANGRLAPAPGTSPRAMLLQWVHFAEATATPPIGDVIDHTFFRPEAERIPAVLAEGRTTIRHGGPSSTVELIPRGDETDLVVTHQLVILDAGDTAEDRERGWG